MTGSQALETLSVFAVVVVLAATFAERLTEGYRARQLARVREAERLLKRKSTQTALDDAYQAARDQALARAETGQGWAMPSREQVRAVLASVTGEHDRVALSGDERLAFDLLADALTGSGSEEADRG